MKLVNFPVWMRALLVVTLLLCFMAGIIVLAATPGIISRWQIVPWLNKWQTLIAGIIAFIGAAWTVAAIRQQIKQVAGSEERRRKREEIAARAALPIAQIEIFKFARACMVQIGERSKDAVQNDGASFLDWKPPSIDTVKIVKIIGECIKFSNENTAIRLAAILYHLQSAEEHVRRLVDKSVVDDNFRRKNSLAGSGVAHIMQLSDALKASAELVVLNQSLFTYSREGEEKLERVSRKEIVQVLHEAGVSIAWVDTNIMGDGTQPETSEKFEAFLNRPRRGH